MHRGFGVLRRCVFGVVVILWFGIRKPMEARSAYMMVDRSRNYYVWTRNARTVFVLDLLLPEMPARGK